MLIEKANTEYLVYRIPGMVRTAQKSLLCCYECRKGSASDWAQIDLKVVRSTDDGQTWQTVLLIPGGEDTLNNPVLIADGQNVHFLFCRNYRRLYHCVSADDGRSFSQPVEITSVFEELDRPYTVAAVGPGHGIVHNGNLLIPAWFAWDPEDAKAHRPSFIGSVYSQDHGKTWHCGEVLDESLLINPSECAFAINAQGQVVNSIRNENPEHLRALAFSPNGYSDWTAPTLQKTLPDPICQGSMDHRDGKIFHINCRGPEGGADPSQGVSGETRKNLTVNITDDNFNTVQSIFVDEMGGYSDLVVTEEAIYVIFEKNFRENGLDFCKINLV